MMTATIVPMWWTRLNSGAGVGRSHGPSWLALCYLLIATGALAQSTQRPPTFELSISNPGARSLGLGGAFVALADDATAAFANPAGLVQLVKPEVSFEARLRVGAEASEENQEQTYWGLTGLSFGSFVLPKGDWAVAFNGHRVASLELETATTDSSPKPESAWPISELDVVRYAIAGAVRPTEHLSVGFGLSYYQGEFEVAMPSSQTGALAVRSADSQTTFFEDNDFGLSAGVLWNPSEQWHFGGFYREGPRFRFASGDSAVSEGLRPKSNSLAFPNAYGLGGAFRSGDGAFTFAIEWDRISYSGYLLRWQRDQVGSGRLTIDDTNEAHVGCEYAFLRSTPLIAVRSGIWFEPGHTIRYHGDDPTMATKYPKAEDRWHFSTGLGLAFKHAQIDFGADFSDPITALSVSCILNL
jgi:long-chain fatty acid transport protein